MPRTTLLDIAKANAADSTVGLIEEVITTHPELTLGHARTIRGINYETLVRTALPSGSSFRSGNDGVDPSKSSYENRLVETYIFDRRWEADKAIADRYEDGAEAYIAMEAIGQLKKGMVDLGAQFYYGQTAAYGGDPSAFHGMLTMHDAANMVVDAGGTTDDTATSVWFVCFGPQSVQWVWGQGGSMDPTDVRIETITGTNGKKLDGYVQTMLAYPGLQVGSINDVVRIKKITEDAGKTLTDKLINAALAKFPSGISPSVVFMTRRSAVQLADSRTATTITGAPAPVPTHIVGLAGEQIPIALTDSIRNTEKLAW